MADDVNRIFLNSNYINQLPDKENVKKINAAVSIDDTEGEIDIFYIPERIIIEKNLPGWLKGSSQVGNIHPEIVRVGLAEYVVKETVKKIPISKVLIENNVRHIKHLKLDTEGCDCYILKCFMNYLSDKSREYYPDIIDFESNFLTSESLVSEVIDLYIDQGYELLYRTANTRLKKK